MRGWAEVDGEDEGGCTIPCSPVALHRPPMTVNKNSIPSVLKGVLSNLHARFVTNTLRVTFDLHARQTTITEKNSRV